MSVVITGPGQKGPKGDPGPQGAPGPAGEGQPRWSGHGAPTLILNSEPGDLYIDLDTGTIYQLQ